MTGPLRIHYAGPLGGGPPAPFRSDSLASETLKHTIMTPPLRQGDEYENVDIFFELNTFVCGWCYFVVNISHVLIAVSHQLVRCVIRGIVAVGICEESDDATLRKKSKKREEVT